MIQREDHGGVVVLRLAHGKANALDVELFQTLDRLLAEIEADDDVRAVVLAGSGKMFSAGVDLFRMLQDGNAYLGELVPLFPKVIGRLFLLPKPVVAAVGGHAIAGGCVLLCACDHVVAADGELRIGLSELPVGVPFPVIALEMVRNRVGDAMARRLVYSGALLGPREARDAGLVDDVVDPGELEDHAKGVARRLGAAAPRAFALTKRHFRQDALDRAERLADHDREVLEVWQAPETHARIRVFLERTVGKKEE